MRRIVGKLVGVLLGIVLVRANPVVGAVLGLLLGHAWDAGWLAARRAPDAGDDAAARAPDPGLVSADPYAVLGVSPQDSDADIELAYRRLIARTHPDRHVGGSETERAQAEQRTRQLNAAYDRIRTLRRARATPPS